MAITALPLPPQRSDPTNFPARADTFMSALPTFATEANALQVDVNNKQSLAAASQLSASLSESAAAASALAAQAAASVSIWVSGTTYAIGDCRFSPIDFRTYRRKTNGAGTTDPSVDSSNWQLVSNGPDGYLQVRDEKTTGSSGGDSLAGSYQIRTLNTVKTNTIPSASLSSNIITLPAGTYDFLIYAPAGNGVASHRLKLTNVTDSSFIFGVSERAGSTGTTKAMLSGRLTITSAKNFQVEHYTQSSAASGLGSPVNDGQIEVYTSAEFWKVA